MPSFHRTFLIALFQLCGFHVDSYLNQISSNSMDVLFDKLHQIKSSFDNPNVQALIKSVEESRQRKWYSNSSAPVAASPQYAKNNSYANENGNVNPAIDNQT
jgi:hypothetical protein